MLHLCALAFVIAMSSTSGGIEMTSADGFHMHSTAGSVTVSGEDGVVVEAGSAATCVEQGLITARQIPTSNSFKILATASNYRFKHVRGSLIGDYDQAGTPKNPRARAFHHTPLQALRKIPNP